MARVIVHHWRANPDLAASVELLATRADAECDSAGGN
jgi:hypothetical protein